MSGDSNGVTRLDPAEYWRLRASSLELERDQTALTAIQARIEASRTKHAVLWQTLAEKYQLDPQGRYAVRDDECALALAPAEP